MDCNITWNYYSLINELTQGMEHTKQLRTYLSSVASTSTSESTPELLLQKILSSYEQSLLILKWNVSAPQSVQPLPPTGSAIEPQVSADRSPRGDDKKRSFKDHSELIVISKRSKKSQPTWTEQVRLRAESGLETPFDGYSWRKYGQDDILGAKYPISYFRCIHHRTQNCEAIKQVKRSDDDPIAFEIIYEGSHTCQLASNSALQATSPEKQANHQTMIGGGYAPSFVRTESLSDSFEGHIDGGHSWRDYGQKHILGAKYPRRSQPTWTVQLKVSVENRFEGPTDDGYSWRKYGQKDILGAKYPRYYFRCTHRNTQGCLATKQMQKSDYDPLIFQIIYKGRHTCKLATNSALKQHHQRKKLLILQLQAASPEKEAPNSALKQHHQRKKLLILQLRAASPEKEAPNSALQAASPEKEASHHSVIVGGSSQPIVSPTTPESNYFSVSSCQMNGLETVPNLSHSESYPSDNGIFLELRHSDSNRTDTLSANTSTTSSSIGGEFTRLDVSIWSKRHPQTQDNTLQKEDKDE